MYYKTVQLMWPKLPNQSIPFNIYHKGLGPYIWAITFYMFTVYMQWIVWDSAM